MIPCIRICWLHWIERNEHHKNDALALKENGIVPLSSSRCYVLLTLDWPLISPFLY